MDRPNACVVCLATAVFALALSALGAAAAEPEKRAPAAVPILVPAVARPAAVAAPVEEAAAEAVPKPSEKPQAAEKPEAEGAGAKPQATEKPGPKPQDAPKPEEPPAPPPEELAALVRQLGDPSYETRARATQQLEALGLKARAAVTAGLKDPDPEVRRRARWVLADVLEADHRRRLESLASDEEGRPDHDLPLWSRYRRVIGFDKPARELFVQMQRAEEGLMASAAVGSAPAADSLKVRFQQVFRMMNNPDPTRQTTPSLGTIAALLFVVGNTELDLPQDIIDSPYLQNVVHQPEFQKALGAEDLKPVAKKILGQWILRPCNPGMLPNRLQLAMQFRIEEGLYPAVGVLRNKDKNQVPSYVRVYAVSALGVLGGKPYAGHFVPLLDDETECQRFMVNNKTHVIQTRDVALAWLVHLTEQAHDDYGFSNAKAEFDRLKQNQHYYVNFGAFNYKDGASREASIKKFKEWLSAHPLPKAPEPPKPDPDPAASKPAEAATPQPAKAAAGQRRVPVFMPGFGIVQVAAKPDDAKGRGLGVAVADRLQVRSLILAEELVRGRRYAEAARMLGEILAARDDFSFQPDPGVPLYRCLKSEAERILAQMPAEGIEAYRLQYEPQAKQALEQAVRSADPELLSAVTARYFHTRSGTEAAYLLGAYHDDHGEPFRAALYLERLRDRSPEADRFEPMLSLKLAACWSRSGMPAAAEAVLRALQARGPRAPVYVAGQPKEMFAQPDRAMQWLASLIGPVPPVPSTDGWLLFRGGPGRNASADVGGPYVAAEPLSPVCLDPRVRETADKLRKDQQAAFRASLPKLHPLVVGGAILLRTATELRAIDFSDGHVLWEAPLEDPLRFFLQHADDRQKNEQNDYFNRGLRRRFWDDSAFGLLASDGQLVYGVEDLEFGFRADFQRLVVTPDGRRRLDPAFDKDYNLLVAYDLKTGKAQWELGGPPEVESSPLAGAYFLGPPLPLGGRLYAIADFGVETRLLELEAKTGRLLWQFTLATREIDPNARQMHMFMPFGMPDSRPPRSAATPSYADGVLVCRTADEHFVGVNLTTRSVQWIYETGQHDENDDGTGMMFFGNPWMRRMYEAAMSDRDDRWADASVTIAEGRILLTPPEAGKLICLGLADGHLKWSIPRRDGLYLATIHEGRAVVVGRGSVWAVGLADGKPAWPPIHLPAGALASGRGFDHGGTYFLPLTTAEVAAIDLREGRIEARSRSPAGIVPGNLVACRGVVLSQDVDGLRRFATLEDRGAQTAAALAAKPDDPQALADRGEALVCQGKLREAVDLLERSLKARPEQRTRQLLIAAVEDGLRTDFAAFGKLAADLDPLIESPDLRVRYLRHLAAAQQQAGQAETAFQTYLKLIDAAPEQEELEHATATRMVRRDRWIAARLAELREAASPEVRQRLDRAIAARMRDDKLAEFVRYFGPHPLAHEARLRLARQLAERKEWGQAEWHLREVLESGDEAQKRLAVARLAEMLRTAGRAEAAARFYRQLSGPLAGAVCAEGKTGAQIAAALVADDPVRQALDPKSPWPEGEVKVEVANRGQGFNQRYPVTLWGAGGPLDVPMRLEIDGGGQQLLGTDDSGRKLWDVSPPQRPSRWGYNGTVFSYAQGRATGHTPVVWLGTRVCAVDTLGGEAKALWVEPTVTADPPVPGMAVFMPWRMQQFRQARPSIASECLPLVVTSHCVCFQQEHKLVALDPLTGKLLWSRSDVDRNADLFGDDELIFVTGSNTTEAAVYSALDGSERGWRTVPELRRRLAVTGRRVVTWQTAGDGCRLEMVDAWTGEVAWTRPFDPKAQPWMLGDDQVAVFDPQGRLAIVDAATGEKVVESQLDAEPSLEGVVVLRSADRYVVVANRPGQQAGPIMMQMAPGNVNAHGRVTGVDRKTGKKLWTAEVTDLAVRADQPGGLPVVVFHNMYHRQENNQFKSYETTLVLDRRDGKKLHEKKHDGASGNLYEYVPDPQNGKLEVRTVRESITLTFAADKK